MNMTSANYLPAGCKVVKLNLGNAYRTTYTHLVVGDDIRVRITPWGLDPAATVAPKNSFWARVSKVERGTGYVQIWVTFGTEERAVRWTAAHTAVTRKERAAEYSARLMLAEQEREASLKASAEELERKRAVASLPLEEPASLAAGLVKIGQELGAADPVGHALTAIDSLLDSSVDQVRDYYRLVYAELVSIRDRARSLQCGQGHRHVTMLDTRQCDIQARLAHVKAGGTWDDAAPAITAGARVHFADFPGDTFTVAFTYGDMGQQYADLVADSGDRIREARWEDLTLAARQAEPVSVHTPKLDDAGLCKLVVDRPSGIPAICGEPVKSAIHDPAAFSAYHAELALELKKWQDPSGAELDRMLEKAFPIPAQRSTELDDARLIQQVAYARGGQPAQDLADMRVRATTAEAKLETMRTTMTMLATEARSRAANWTPEHGITTLELESKADLLDVLLRLLDS